MKRGSSQPSLPTAVCVKVKFLRPRHDNRREWLECEDHHLATRHGRVFIGSGEDKYVYHYKSSEWANPFTVKQHGLDKSLKLFSEHLDTLLEDEEVRARFRRLADMSEIGCFCNPGDRCHREVILSKLSDLLQAEEAEEAGEEEIRQKTK